ncbi:MAG: glycosyltransferase [Bdellovibrionales bacterium]|nr:glycosyltransferase [Bdellovibrionales bacterium]
MKIVHVIWARFPVGGYGGTERVSWWLGKAQAEMGHEVTYLCLPGSRIPFASAREIPSDLRHLDPLLPPGTDIVQLYGAPHYRIDAPHLVNIGGNGQPGEKYPANTVFVSRNHALRHGWTEFVHNGVDLAEYPLCGAKENFALFLAKASWSVKNLRGAIRIARDARLPLHVAGGRAGCWRRGVVSHGTVDGGEKLSLLQRAGALLFPVIWEEPFGLAVVEALACGTPVVATPRGALPEIVDSTCGILAGSHEGLVEALRERERFSPEACRARVEAAFTHIHMAEKYLLYYKMILEKGRIREGHPEAPADADPERKIYYEGYRR